MNHHPLFKPYFLAGMASKVPLDSRNIHPRCLNEATPRRKHLLFQLPLLRLEIPPWSDHISTAEVALWKHRTLRFLWMWKLLETSLPCEMHQIIPTNSNVSRRILGNSEKMLSGIFSGNSFWMVLTCFGLKVHTKNVKCAVTTNSSPIVSSSSSSFKSRICILGTWILWLSPKHRFLWLNVVWRSKSVCEVWQNVNSVPQLYWTSDFCEHQLSDQKFWMPSTF